MKNAFCIGERVYLRPIEREDVPLLLEWINNPDVNLYLARHLPINEVREREWVEGLYKGPNDLVLLLVAREGDRPIGNCGLHGLAGPDRHAELGILIGEPAFQSRGYGGEALRLLCDYGFNRLNLHRIGLRVYAYNRRAIRCYEKAGFRHEGVQREGRFLNGEWYDVLQLGILDHEFRARAPSSAASCQGAPS